MATTRRGRGEKNKYSWIQIRKVNLLFLPKRRGENKESDEERNRNKVTERAERTNFVKSAC